MSDECRFTKDIVQWTWLASTARSSYFYVGRSPIRRRPKIAKYWKADGIITILHVADVAWRFASIDRSRLARRILGSNDPLDAVT
jgi:hypothetical protein